MGKTKWTEEQQSAIDTRECNLLVAAAAGSGKTAVLVERIIKIITDEKKPVDVDKLLVVTFTNAAAAEMRERIAGAITKALEKNPSSKNLQKQLTLLSRANITTMHSFCLDTIKNNFHVINLDPSFRILDETEGILLKDEILEKLFQEKYDDENQEFLNLVEAYSGSKNDEKLKEIILNLYRFSMSGADPENWLMEKADEFNIDTIEDLDKSLWMKVLKDNLKIELEGLISMAQKAIELCNSCGGLEPYIQNFNDDIVQIQMIYDSLNLSIKDIYANCTFSKLKTIKRDTVEDEEVQKRVKKIRDDIKKNIKKIINDIFPMTPETMLQAIKSVYPFMKELSSTVIEFQSIFLKAKKEKNSLDFNDLEHFCLKILKDEKAKVADKFKEKFYEVLVDEYQDSNNVQEAIIDLVSRKYDDNPNVFMVGDVKQSIYRFRQAKPELFLDKYNTYSKEEGKCRKIQLYKNFRSREEVVSGVNYIFKEIMSKMVGDLEYTDEEALNLGAFYKELNEENSVIGGEVELNILNKAMQEDLEDSSDGDIVQTEEDDEDVSAINLEARIVAKRIKELMSVKDGKEFKVLDKNTGEYRKVKYKDIVILLRATKNWSEIFLDEIGAEGIPIYADTGVGYFESIEIRTILSMLKVIDNPLNDIPLIALLKSPIMNFSVLELSLIRLVNKDNYYYDNIKLIASGDSSSSEELKEKCSRFLKRLNVWREKSVYTSIDEFIWYLYSDTGYYGYVGAMPNGVLRQANLKVLFQRAKQFEETSFKGLFNFVNFINKLRKSSGDMGSAKILGENEDVVRIMSIHKSKGLEFPVVFLSGAGKQFNLMDLTNSILYHDDLGFGPEYLDLEKRISYSTIAKEAIKRKIKLETLSEEMRILYVAFTRAKEKLIITGATSNLDKLLDKTCNAAALDENIILPSEVLKGKSYLDWITMAMCKHKDGEILTNLKGAVDIHIKQDLSTWKIKIWQKSDLTVDKVIENVEDEENLKLLTSKNCGQIDKEIKNRLDFRYKYKQSTTMKSNISVSDLKKKNQEEHNIPDTKKIFNEDRVIKPKFLKEDTAITSSERGTAMHFMMQRVDFSRISTVQEIRDQIKELLEGELISQKEADAINAKKVFEFFKSSLGKRVLKSKKVYRELPFYTEISEDNIEDKIRLQGVIDCFFYEGDQIVLLDYKTDYVEDGNEEEMINRYKVQLGYYKDALEKITEKEVNETFLYLFHLGKELKIIL